MAVGGFVKLPRHVATSPVFRDAELLRLYIWCLCKAAWRDQTESVRVGRGHVSVKLLPGQFVFQKSAAARELGGDPVTIWRRMKRLEEMGFIAIKVQRQFSIISVINANTYKEETFDDATPMQRLTREMCNTKQDENSLQNNGLESKPEFSATPNSPNVHRKKYLEEIKKKPTSPQGGDGFDLFWSKYPRKIGKQAALKAWKRTASIRPSLDDLCAALECQKRSPQWQKDGGQYIPYPSTWLNAGRWEDEIQDEPEDDCTFFRPYLRGKS